MIHDYIIISLLTDTTVYILPIYGDGSLVINEMLQVIQPTNFTRKLPLSSLKRLPPGFQFQVLTIAALLHVQYCNQQG